MDYLQRAMDSFSGDSFAVGLTGVKMLEVRELYAKCSLEIEEKHLNNYRTVMAGAIFTLADFAFGTAANTPVTNCVTLSSNINFMRPTSGPVLYAEARCTKNGRNVCFFDIDVTDSEGRLIANAQFSGYRSEPKDTQGAK